MFKVLNKKTLGKAPSPITSICGGIFHYSYEADAIFMHYKATLYQFIAPQMSALILMAAKHIANMFCPLMPWNRVIIPFYSHCNGGTDGCREGSKIKTENQVPSEIRAHIH